MTGACAHCGQGGKLASYRMWRVGTRLLHEECAALLSGLGMNLSYLDGQPVIASRGERSRERAA